MRPNKGVMGTMLGLAAIALAFHCNTSFDQCASDDDCFRMAGISPSSGASLQCVSGSCQGSPTVASGIDGGEQETPCVTNDDCVQRNDGEPSYCRTPNTPSCVKLTSDVCQKTTTLTDGTTRDNLSPNWKDIIPGTPPLIVGVIAPRTIKNAAGGEELSSYDDANLLGLQLASDNWGARTPGGLVVSGKKQPIVHVVCNSQHDKTRALQAISDLEQMGSKLLIVRSATDADENGVAAAALEKDMLVVCSDCLGGVIPPSQTGGHVWYVQPAVSTLGDVMAAGVNAFEKKVTESAQANAADDKIRIAVVASGNGTLQKITDAMEAGLTLNGAPALGNANYRRINLPNDRETAPDYTKLVNDLVEFQPDIIATNMGAPWGLFLFKPLEDKWKALVGPKHAPYYVAGNDEAFSLSDPAFLSARKRILGLRMLAPQAVADNHFAYVQNYKSKYGVDPGNVDSAYEAYYTSAFLLAATLTRQGVSPASLTGAALAESFARLRPPVGNAGTAPTEVSHVPGDIQSGVDLLSNLKSIDLKGVLSTLDWDLTTGEVTQDIRLDCINFKETGTEGPPVSFIASGIGAVGGGEITTELDTTACGW